MLNDCLFVCFLLILAVATLSMVKLPSTRDGLASFLIGCFCILSIVAVVIFIVFAEVEAIKLT